MVVPSSVRYPMLLLWAIHVEKHSPGTGPLFFAPPSLSAPWVDPRCGCIGAVASQVYDGNIHE